MQNRGLLFIPDISGFTRFINEMEIEHSRLIIQELLEILINANQLGLEVSEIEGDAILFYKFGDSPALEELYKQVEKMFCDFHSNIIAYEYRRFCQCKACTSAIDLTLKVITHYGEFTDYQVKDFKKLIGKDIIVAHQLLKNDIGQHEYWLVSKSLLEHAPKVDLANWLRWDSSVKQTERGEIFFHYTHLGGLKKGISLVPLTNLEPNDKTKMISLSKEYETDIITLFHATGDFNYRSRWQEGVNRVEEVSHFLPRVGMQCRYIFDNGQVTIFTSSYRYHPDRIEFSETDERKKNVQYYLLEKTSDTTTKLTIDFYLKKNFVTRTYFTLVIKKTMEVNIHRSLQNLVALVKEITSTAKAV